MRKLFINASLVFLFLFATVSLIKTTELVFADAPLPSGNFGGSGSGNFGGSGSGGSGPSIPSSGGHTSAYTGGGPGSSGRTSGRSGVTVYTCGVNPNTTVRNGDTVTAHVNTRHFQENFDTYIRGAQSHSSNHQGGHTGGYTSSYTGSYTSSYTGSYTSSYTSSYTGSYSNTVSPSNHASVPR